MGGLTGRWSPCDASTAAEGGRAGPRPGPRHLHRSVPKNSALGMQPSPPQRGKQGAASAAEGVISNRPVAGIRGLKRGPVCARVLIDALLPRCCGRKDRGSMASGAGCGAPVRPMACGWGSRGRARNPDGAACTGRTQASLQIIALGCRRLPCMSRFVVSGDTQKSRVGYPSVKSGCLVANSRWPAPPRRPAGGEARQQALCANTRPDAVGGLD